MQEILVLITENCEYTDLIRTGEGIAANEGKPLKVVSIKPKNALKDSHGAALEKLFALTRKAGAEMVVFFNDDPASIVLQYIQRNNVARLVAGVPATSRESACVGRIRRACPEMPILFVGEQGPLPAYPPLYAPAGTSVSYSF